MAISLSITLIFFHCSHFYLKTIQDYQTTINIALNSLFF